MLANLLSVAGVNHVITIDLHASQMQGFFKCPVDNLVAEPLIARWIKTNIRDWTHAVVVSKNPGGTKRVTSMADAMKLSFGIVTTDRAREPHGSSSMMGSMMFEKLVDGLVREEDFFGNEEGEELRNGDGFATPVETPDKLRSDDTTPDGASTPNAEISWHRTDSTSTQMRVPLESFEPLPLTTSASDVPPSINPDDVITNDLRRSRTEPAEIAELEEEFNDEVCDFQSLSSTTILTLNSAPEMWLSGDLSMATLSMTTTQLNLRQHFQPHEALLQTHHASLACLAPEQAIIAVTVAVLTVVTHQST